MKRAIVFSAMIACTPNGEKLERTCASGRFEVYATTVRDTAKKKVWERFPPPMTMPYADAQKHCESLKMTVPINMTLIDLMSTGTSDLQPVDTCAFPTPPIPDAGADVFSYGIFWTNTPSGIPVIGPYIGAPVKENEHVVIWGKAQIGKDDTNKLNRIRCVRE